MSLSQDLRKVTEDGVTFQSHIDGSRHVLTPERAIEIQADLLGSDIVMQLDECVALPAERREAARGDAAARSRWAERCKARVRRAAASAGQALFGIQQGGTRRRLRRDRPSADRASASTATRIGGLAVGEGHAGDVRDARLRAAMLPADRPRYLMGVGKPVDLVEAVARGVDMFDCVLPTRSGRHGQAWTWDGAVNLKNARFADDPSPLDPASDCPAAATTRRPTCTTW